MSLGSLGGVELLVDGKWSTSTEGRQQEWD